MKSGTSTGSIVESPRRKKRRAKERAAEEARWASLNGPVKTWVDPSVRRDREPI